MVPLSAGLLPTGAQALGLRSPVRVRLAGGRLSPRPVDGGREAPLGS
jgi:hypothetical protein